MVEQQNELLGPIRMCCFCQSVVVAAAVVVVVVVVVVEVVVVVVEVVVVVAVAVAVIVVALLSLSPFTTQTPLLRSNPQEESCGFTLGHRQGIGGLEELAVGPV